MTRAIEHRWASGLVGTLLLVSIALLYAEPTLLVLAIVPLAYVAYGSLSSAPEPTVSIERSLSTTTPMPGTTVTVELSVENTGDRTLPDVRVVDGVPAELVVTDGPARGCLSLSTGERATVSYEVMTHRGEYDFGEPTVRCRSLSGSRMVTTTVSAGGDQRLSCSGTVAETARKRAVRSRLGTLPTDEGGPGLEFHSTREYRSGDPTNRIDWRRLARTDQLSTVNFREEQAARLVVVVDARPVTRVAPRAGYPTGAELAAYAGERAYAYLTSAGHQASVTALGLESAVRDDHHPAEGLPWVTATGNGGSTAEAIRLFEAIDRAADRGGVAEVVTAPIETDARTDIAETLLARLPPDAQVLLTTPLLDDLPISIVRSIRERGYPVTVLSPDVTASTTAGGRLIANQREDRLVTLRLGGADVVDWSPADPLEVALSSSLPEVIPQ